MQGEAQPSANRLIRQPPPRWPETVCAPRRVGECSARVPPCPVVRPAAGRCVSPGRHRGPSGPCAGEALARQAGGTPHAPGRLHADPLLQEPARPARCPGSPVVQRAGFVPLGSRRPGENGRSAQGRGLLRHQPRQKARRAHPDRRVEPSRRRWPRAHRGFSVREEL